MRTNRITIILSVCKKLCFHDSRLILPSWLIVFKAYCFMRNYLIINYLLNILLAIISLIIIDLY